MKFEILSLADGWTGTDQTVAKVQQLADDALRDPVVHMKAEDIVRHVRERDKRGEIRAISKWVRSHMKYRGEGIEKTKTPRWLLDEIRKYGFGQGDCDDFVCLQLALYRALGHPAQARVISQRKNGQANHIYAEVFDGKRWIADDGIKKDQPLGWSAPNAAVTKSKRYPMNDPIRAAFRPRLSGSACRTVSPFSNSGGSRSYQVAPDFGIGGRRELLECGPQTRGLG